MLCARLPVRSRFANKIPFLPYFLVHRASQCGKLRPVIQPGDNQIKRVGFELLSEGTSSIDRKGE